MPPELITTHKLDINTGNERKIISRTKGKNIIMVLVLAFNFQIWITHFCHPTCLSEYHNNRHDSLLPLTEQPWRSLNSLKFGNDMQF